MKVFRTAAFLLVLLAPTAMAATYHKTTESDCSQIDFRDTLKMKIRNQNKVSWCFAHAASDYLQYTYGLSDQISAADIAINYSQSSLSKLIGFLKRINNSEARSLPAQTGFIKIAVKKIIPQGYCPESALPSEEWTRVDQNGTESKVEIRQSLLDVAALQTLVKNGGLSSAADLPWYFRFKNIDASQFFDLLKSSKKGRLILNIRAAACDGERRPFGTNQIHSDFQIRGKNVFKNMNASFDRDMPVTIDFFSDILRNFDNPKRNISNMHTVLVYGRRFDRTTQQCNYMIKDSYGEQCTKYDAKIPCENGYVWLPENKLFRAMTSQLILSR